MVRAAIALLVSSIAAPALPALGEALPAPQAGVSLFWASQYEGDSSSFREVIVAAGDDWALYVSLFDDGYPDPEASVAADHFILFSGIDYRSCDGDEMPSEQERADLAALFPLEEGAVLETSSLPGSPVIRVGAVEEYYLMGETRLANRVLFDYPEDDEENEDETLIVLQDAPYTAVVDWGENGSDRLMLIAQSEETLDVPDPALLGTCASLLN